MFKRQLKQASNLKNKQKKDVRKIKTIKGTKKTATKIRKVTDTLREKRKNTIHGTKTRCWGKNIQRIRYQKYDGRNKNSIEVRNTTLKNSTRNKKTKKTGKMRKLVDQSRESL